MVSSQPPPPLRWLVLCSLLFPFASFAFIDHSILLSSILLGSGLLFVHQLVKTYEAELARHRSPLPTPRGASTGRPRPKYIKRLRHILLDISSLKSNSKAAQTSTLATTIFHCLSLQLLVRLLYLIGRNKVEAMEYDKPLTSTGVGPSALMFQREMQNLLLTWKLENTVENDPLTKSLLASPKLSQISLPYMSRIIGREDVSGRPGKTGVGPMGINDLTSTGLSVVLPCHNEHPYVERTVISILNETSPLVLREIIVIDDFNDPPISTAFNDELLAHPKLKIVRNNARQGLIRAKQAGGEMALGSQILFLDAHVKPFPKYLPWLMKDLSTKWNRIVVPSIPILNADTWEQEGTAVGYKMMFDWQLRFNWFEDDDDEVPIMSGGLLALNKSWWNYTGGFDRGMDVWGGENIEQSVKSWMAGGEIVVNRQSLIAHYFRTRFPYTVDQTAVTRNKIRVATTWFDRWVYVINAHIRSSSNKELNVTEALALRNEIAPNRHFDWYVDRFRKSLSRAKLIYLPRFIISPKLTNPNSARECLTVEHNSTLTLRECDTNIDYWILEGSKPEDVFPLMKSNQLAAPPPSKKKNFENRETDQLMVDDLFCEENPVCRKNAAFIRNPPSDVCVGAIKQFDVKTSRDGFYLGVGKHCQRSGSFRDFTKSVGFIPTNVRQVGGGANDWEDIMWNRLLPRPTRNLELEAQTIQPNATNVAADQLLEEVYYVGYINWGSFCLDLGDNRQPLARLCSEDQTNQEWEFRFVNKPHDFWSLNK